MTRGIRPPVLGFLFALLALSTPVGSQAALMRYTLTTTLGENSWLGAANISGQDLRVYADIDSTTAEYTSRSGGSSGGYSDVDPNSGVWYSSSWSDSRTDASSKAAVVGSVYFQVGEFRGEMLGMNWIQTGFYQQMNSNSYSGFDGYDYYYSDSFTNSYSAFGFSRDSNTRINDLGTSNNYYGGGFDINMMSTASGYLGGGWPSRSSDQFVTSAGTLSFGNFNYTWDSITSEVAPSGRASVPEPSQVALGVLAAGYAMLSAGRRYRQRRKPSA